MEGIEARILRARKAESLICKYGTLALAAPHMGVCSERVRQIMVEGHKNGWVTYRPFFKQRSCAAIAKLPQALKVAKSEAELSSLCGLDSETGRKTFRRIGLESKALRKRFAENKATFYLNRLRNVAARLGIADTLNTSVIQSCPEGKTAYNNIVRHVGGIAAARVALGVHAIVRPGRRPS